MNIPSYVVNVIYRKSIIYKKFPYKISPVVKLSKENDNYLRKDNDTSKERKQYYGKKRRYYADYC